MQRVLFALAGLDLLRAAFGVGLWAGEIFTAGYSFVLLGGDCERYSGLWVKQLPEWAVRGEELR